MGRLILVTLKGVFRDRVFQGILLAAVAFPFIPSISTLSMRQVTELSITLSLSLISFILLLLSVFLGGTSLWKDMERRYTFSVLALPMRRAEYLVGKFAGISLFLLLTAVLLGLAAFLVISYVSGIYPPERPVICSNVLYSILFDTLKYTLLIAFAFLFSTVSTSFFLPIFGTIATFLVGSATQEVYDFVHSPAGQALSPVVRKSTLILYYILPNFAAFDLKVNAIYGVKLSPSGLLLTSAYFLVYIIALLTISIMILSRREMK